MNNKKILYVGFRNFRHSRMGGYDYITQNPHTSYLNAKNLPFGFLSIGQRGHRLSRFILDIYARLKSKAYNVIHYFYADYTIFFPFIKKGGQKIIATIHTNYKEWGPYKRLLMKSFDAIICLSNQQAKELREKGYNAFFIPHGFNSPKFSFDECFVKSNMDIEKKINVSYCGQMYRDFNTLLMIIHKYSNTNVFFHVFGQKESQKKKLLSLKNVKVYDHLDDDKYYSMLQSCDYSFLPLTFATANNALLEQQGLGVISILPNINGVTDYADKDNNLFYNNNDELINIFQNLKKQEKSKKLQTFAQKYYWDNIYKELNKLYNTL